jgi:hypothetical protein
MNRHSSQPNARIVIKSRRNSVGGAIVIAWVLIVGPPPLPDKIDLLVGLIGQGLAVGLGVWLLLCFAASTDKAYPIRLQVQCTEE